MEKLSESTKTQNIPKVKLALEDSLKAVRIGVAAEESVQTHMPVRLG